MPLSSSFPELLEPRLLELEPRSDDEPCIPSSELGVFELPLRPIEPLLDEPERPDELLELPGALMPPWPPCVLLDEPRDEPPLCDAPIPPLLPDEPPVEPVLPAPPSPPELEPLEPADEPLDPPEVCPAPLPVRVAELPIPSSPWLPRSVREVCDSSPIFSDDLSPCDPLSPPELAEPDEPDIPEFCALDDPRLRS